MKKSTQKIVLIIAVLAALWYMLNLPNERPVTHLVRANEQQLERRAR